MKTKNDYITNSSSSNFIVANSRPNKEMKIAITLELDLHDLIEDKAETIDELMEFNQHQFIEEDYLEECKKAIENGATVYFLGVSEYSESRAEMLLHGKILTIDMLVEKEGVNIIDGDGRY